MRYKVVALLDLLFGLGGFVLAFYYYFLVFAKIRQVYEEMGTPIDLTRSYIGFGLLLLVACVSLFLAFKLYAQKSKKLDTYFALGIIIPFLACFFVPSFLAVSILLPMFNLVNVIE